ncbi:hypothetical protein ACIPJG_26765 [Streptomyces halstedii]|uniref:hypothetical protein n=1 Tax=Streptomyces halstedii TaxID=1944 RepID=UPI0038240ECD
MRRLEEAARRYLAGKSYPGQEPGITAVDYCQAVPVVVTELERIPADPDGAVGKVWRGLGRDEDEWRTLGEALDSRDGEHLYAVPRKEAHRGQKEREAAERSPPTIDGSRPGVIPASIRQSNWRAADEMSCAGRA